VEHGLKPDDSETGTVGASKLVNAQSITDMCVISVKLNSSTVVTVTTTPVTNYTIPNAQNGDVVIFVYADDLNGDGIPDILQDVTITVKHKDGAGGTLKSDDAVTGTLNLSKQVNSATITDMCVGQVRLNGTIMVTVSSTPVTNYIIPSAKNGDIVEFIYAPDLNGDGLPDVPLGPTGQMAYNEVLTQRIIPPGFTESVVVGETSVSDGLVIIDGSGNEFVWVPVATSYKTATLTTNIEIVTPTGWKKVNTTTYTRNYLENTAGTLVMEDLLGNPGSVALAVTGLSNMQYAKWTTAGLAYNSSSIQGDDLPTKIAGTWGQTEVSQIEKFGGFYVARYEAGIPANAPAGMGTTATEVARNISGVPQSKRNIVPWDYITYANSKANAESMYNTALVQSGLLTGTMWDTILRWFNNAGYNVNTSSLAWGNHTDATVTGITGATTGNTAGTQTWTNRSNFTKPAGSSFIMRTGISNYVKVKNIYDIAGNCMERTSERTNLSHIARGGAFMGTMTTAAYRQHVSGMDTTVNFAYTFRVALFINANMITGTVNYSNTSPTVGTVTATLTADRPINTPSGWTPVNATTFTKVYSSNTNEEIPLQDSTGNVGAVSVVITNIIDTFEFNYTGSFAYLEVPANGNYRLEVWGAQRRISKHYNIWRQRRICKRRSIFNTRNRPIYICRWLRNHRKYSRRI